MSTIDRIREIAEPLLRDRGLELYDVEQHGPVVRVTVDGSEGVGLDDLSQVTRALSLALDEHDPVPGRYTLEVSSPGLERALRTPRHFEGAIGTEISVKTRHEVDGQRRFAGILQHAGAEGITLRSTDDASVEHRIGYADIDKARTVFHWGPDADKGRSGARRRAPSAGATPADPNATTPQKTPTTTTAKAAPS
jgi:ribosome maturation factor RimP